MARLDNRFLFFTTSPRTPSKMIPEIKLLCEHLAGEKWNNDSQLEFASILANSSIYEGAVSAKYSAFSARDRINRAPKALGFVRLSPTIALTDAGKSLVNGKRPQEAFLRQILKFQLPSPFHTENPAIKDTFCVRPYLEILRLIRELDFITFDEFKIYALQLTDYHNFDSIKQQILDFRASKQSYKGKYKAFVNEVWEEEIKSLFRQQISAGQTSTRESNDSSLENFIKTKKGTMRDYTDACFRYLRYTGLLSLSYKSRSLSILKEKIVDVDFILHNMQRDPVYIDDVSSYENYLFSSSTPELYTDNKDNIIKVLLLHTFHKREDLAKLSLDELKDMQDDNLLQRKENVISQQVKRIKSYKLFEDIIGTFKEIISKECYDAPLMLEYNTWRAMTMLNGGDIKGNFKFDDEGMPLSTASGNMPDIVCDYGSFALSVEVTMQSGQRQYESEGEPVARHYGQLKKSCGKETYCMFIAPTINPATLAHFYGLNKISIKAYGGTSKIIPIELALFIKLVENSMNLEPKPNPNDIKALLDVAIKSCNDAEDEEAWKQMLHDFFCRWRKE